MQIIKRSLVILYLLCFLKIGFTQNVSNSRNILSNYIENLAEYLSVEEIDFQPFYDNLVYYHSHPIPINYTSKNELELLGVLSSFQINRLLEYQDKNGEIYSVYELASIKGFNSSLVQMLSPFISFQQPIKEEFNWQKMWKRQSHELFLKSNQTVQKQTGYLNNSYLGKQQNYLFRYRLQLDKKISFSLLADNDAGEPIIWTKKRKGFDFYSSHLAINQLGKIKTLIIGDYLTQFGQGLTLWNGFAFSGILLHGDLKKAGRNLIPYTSSSESNFFRGVASTIQCNNKIDVSVFYSSKKLDAMVNNGNINTIIENGYHRTVSEIDNKNTIREEVVGTNITYNHKSLKLELTNYNQKHHLNSLNWNNYLGVAHVLQKQNLTWYGELSYLVDKDYGVIQGVNFPLHANINLSSQVRYFGTNYKNRYINTFSSAGGKRNESGIYLSLSGRVKNFSYLILSDYSKSKDLRYRVSRPSTGSMHVIQAQIQIDKNMSIGIQAKERVSLLDLTNNLQTLENTTLIRRQNIRLDLTMSNSDKLSFKFRVEQIWFEQEEHKKEKGFLCFQQVSYSGRNSWKFILRNTLFSTPSYDTRVYTFENDVLFSFSSPAYFYRGNNIFIYVQKDIGKHMSTYFKIGHTYYPYKEKISSGLNEINDNQRTIISLCLKIRV